jgi:hypothetical protein
MIKIMEYKLSKPIVNLITGGLGAGEASPIVPAKMVWCKISRPRSCGYSTIPGKTTHGRTRTQAWRSLREHSVANFSAYRRVFQKMGGHKPGGFDGRKVNQGNQ